MSVTNNRTQQPIQLQTESFFQLVINERHSRAELHIRGSFPSPQDIGDVITDLYHQSENYSTLAIFINSPGGDATTLAEILSAINSYEYIITIGAGQIASAGFFLWCRGDLRVAQAYSSYMAHRESYGGFGMKTDQHIDLANHTNEIYGRMIKEMCDGVLTDEELEKCRYTEVFLSGEELVARDVAISWEDFHRRDTTPVVYSTVVSIGDEIHVVENNRTRVETELGEASIHIFDLLYGNPCPNYEIDLDEDALLTSDEEANKILLETINQEEIAKSIQPVPEDHPTYQPT